MSPNVLNRPESITTHPYQAVFDFTTYDKWFNMMETKGSYRHIQNKIGKTAQH